MVIILSLAVSWEIYICLLPNTFAFDHIHTYNIQPPKVVCVCVCVLVTHTAVDPNETN